MHRRSPVLGRGRNEYGCFTLSGRLYLDNLDGGDEVIRDADSRRGATPLSPIDAAKLGSAAANERSAKLSVSIMKGAYLECDKLYDETLAKWKRKYKTSQALRNLMGTSGATGILSTDPTQDEGDDGGRRSKRAGNEPKLVTRIKQEAAMVEEAKRMRKRKSRTRF